MGLHVSQARLVVTARLYPHLAKTSKPEQGREVTVGDVGGAVGVEHFQLTQVREGERLATGPHSLMFNHVNETQSPSASRVASPWTPSSSRRSRWGAKASADTSCKLRAGATTSLLSS